MWKRLSKTQDYLSITKKKYERYEVKKVTDRRRIFSDSSKR